MRPLYRARQFWQALTAGAPSEPPLELAAGLCGLYQGLSPADRAHGLRTLERLGSEAHSQPDLAAAALLHDVGKSGVGIHLWDRVLYVLAARLAPRWLAQPQRLPAGLAALQRHAEEGARRVEAAGGTARTVALIRHHHADPGALPWLERERALLAALQRADEET